MLGELCFPVMKRCFRGRRKIYSKMQSSPSKSLRKKLGFLKWQFEEKVIYRKAAKDALAARGKLSDLIGRLPSLEKAEVKQDRYEVHMLCGHRDWDMGVLASWSLMRFLPKTRLVVHSDGSLTEDDQRGWRAVIPDVDILDEMKLSRDSDWEERFPNLAEWSGRHIYGAKFVDFHRRSGSDRLIMMDSDVLCFWRPDALLARMEAEDFEAGWNLDLFDGYLGSRAQIEEATGVRPPSCVNAGFVAMKRFLDEDFEKFESWLTAFRASGLDINHHWCEQTLYALAGSLHLKASPLPEPYNIVVGPLSSDQVVRHYVGTNKIRPRFFLEGMPLLAEQAGLTD